MKEDRLENRDNQRDQARSQGEHTLNAEHANGRRPLKFKQRVILGVVLGSFFFLVVGCWYWVGLDKPKIDRSNFNFNHHPDRAKP